MPPPTTSVAKILAAVAAGTIDRATGLMYRVFAFFGDPRLPDSLRGDSAEDMSVFVQLDRELDDLPPDIRDAVWPYMVRPTDPESYWNREIASPTGAAGVQRSGPTPDLLAAPPAAPACVSGWMHDRVSATVPAMIWAECGTSAAAALTTLEEARTYLKRQWGPETTLMGPPVGDANVAWDDYADTPETGDGLIDFYFPSTQASSGQPRDVSIGGYGVARQTPPFAGPSGAETSSAWVVVRPGLTGALLEATITHEFFHVLEMAHNSEGVYDCPITQLGTTCSSLHLHWFMEAAAAWSEHNFVPRARAVADGPYELWKGFVKTSDGLSLTNSSNEYLSWSWALFIEQTHTDAAVASAWDKIRGKVGWRAVQAALDAQLDFDTRFRDFGVEVFNRILTPGNPVNPLFRSATLDPTFPTDSPTGNRYVPDVLDDLIDPMGGASRTYSYTIRIESLSSLYLPIEPPPEARKLTFEFAAFAREIDVDAIVRIGDTWERRKLPPGETVWCLEKPADAFEEGFLVFSNHVQDPGPLTRAWSIKAEEAGCGAPVGTLAYSFLDTAPGISAPGGSSAIDATVQVRLKRNEHIADPYNAMYLNDGSTYGVQTSWKVLLPPGPDGCQGGSTGFGTPGGALELDSVVGNTWVDDDGKSRLTLGIGLPVHEEIDQDWCALGTTHATGDSWVTYPQCDGIETSSTDSTQTFVFDCDFQAASQSWSVSGTIVINR